MLHTELDRRTFVIEFFTGDSGSEDGIEVGPLSMLESALNFVTAVKAISAQPTVGDLYLIASILGFDTFEYGVPRETVVTFAEITAVTDGMTEDGFDRFSFNLRR